MKKLLKMALSHAEQAEVLKISNEVFPLVFENGSFKESNMKRSSGVSLRIVKDGRLGFAYSTSLNHREELVNQAILSSRFGKKTELRFPPPAPLPEIRNFSRTVPRLTSEKLAGQIKEIETYLQNKEIAVPVSVWIYPSRSKISIINSSGLQVSHESTSYTCSIMLTVRNSCAGPFDEISSPAFVSPDPAMLDMLLDFYRHAENTVRIKTGKMKVLFTPHAVGLLDWRIREAINGANMLNGSSPLKDKTGRQVFPEEITITEDPIEPEHYLSRPFDDEGVPTKRIKIFERGVFKNFIFDLSTAAEAQTKPTGTGYKQRDWESGISVPPNPRPLRLRYKEGKSSVKELIEMMDQGLILLLDLGRHSGNILAGDFAVAAGLGYYVRNGKVLGRAVDTMVSGNIYELYNNLLGISRETNSAGTPYLLFDKVRVASK